ncbi:MAG TPA: hypothetical protein VFE78_02375 [Gemmataceae bacterium]|jgi:hypothetical protein|nr:hypothetical protein [Gemmataceae bacterium]
MPADTSRLRPVTQDKPGNDGQALRPAVRRSGLHPALGPAKGEDGPPRETSAPAGLLDYAAFLLEQEARYCQQ